MGPYPRALADLTNTGRTQRNPAVKEPEARKRSLEITSRDSIINAYSTVCCSAHCMGKTSLETITHEREEYAALSMKQQALFIRQKIKSATKDFIFYVDGISMCAAGFMLCCGIKRSRFYEIKKKIANNISAVNTVMPYKKESMRGMRTILWLKNYFQKFGDQLPNSEEIHLPACLNKKAVFQEYMTEMMSQGLKLRQFVSIWTGHFSHVKVVKHQKFTVCTDCKKFKELLLKTRCKEDIEQLQLERRAHLGLQRLCRLRYYKHCNKAAAHPAKYVSLIVDGMDQNKTYLPHFSVKSKVDQSLAPLKHHLTGVINHGQDKAYAFTWTDQFPGDSNITINCLHRVLEDVAKNNHGVMPPVLYLQMDNCCKDNKNRFVFAYLATLVKLKVFKKVKVSFLMVGHTHEDVDQMFSCFSRRLNRHDAATLPDLFAVIKDSYTPSPETANLEHLVDFRGQLTRGVLEGISDPHIFKFEECNGEVLCHYKDWPLDNEEYRTEPVDYMANVALNECLVFVPDGMKTDQVRRSIDITKYERTGCLNETQVEWWKEYLAGLVANAPVPSSITLPSYRIPRQESSSESLLQEIAARMRRQRVPSTMKGRDLKRK